MENKTEQRRRIMEKYSYLDGKKEEIKMMDKCPVCGGNLITISGYSLPNFCRKCDRLIITPEMYEEEENVL